MTTPAAAHHSSTPTPLPDGALDELLRQHAGRPIHLQPGGGNNGDQLIHDGAKVALDRAGCTNFVDADQAELIIMNGGFFVGDKWPGGLREFRSYLENQPHVPLVILPHSFWFATTHLPDLVPPERTAPIHFFARERTSFDIVAPLAFACPAFLGLDHDMAFNLEESEWARRLRASVADDHILVVERIDKESPFRHTEASKPIWHGTGNRPATRPLTRLVPSSFKNALKRRRRWKMAAELEKHSTFAHFAQETTQREQPHAADKPVVYGDISLRDMCNFDEFCSLIARAAAIFTDRLHVGVAGALLGRPTYIRPSDNHKIPGIHALSMTRMQHVRLLEKTDGRPDHAND